MYSLIIPVYKNEAFIPELIETITELNNKLDGQLEAVFVVDGSPDESFRKLSEALPQALFCSRVILLSRNFGSFSAIFKGLEVAQGEYYVVMAADLQEPPELIYESFKSLKNDEGDITIGVRDSRYDSLFTKLSARIFWWICRKFIQKELPVGGVDVFGCNRIVRDQLIRTLEANSSLVLQLYWLGLRRKEIPYVRRKRKYGKSAWSFRKKVTYFMNSIFGYTNLPINLLIWGGAFGVALSVLLIIIVSISYIMNLIPVLGYTPIILGIGFFSAIQMLSLGIVGSYIWRTYENSKFRPITIVQKEESFPKNTLKEETK